MKKLVLLTLVLSAIFSTATFAQTAPDPAVMLQQIKDKVKPLMVEKTGLTEAQADKVIEINFEMRQAAAAFRELSEAERSVKIQELKAARDKKYAAIPLTEAQIKAVKDFYENMGKNAPPKGN